MWETGIHPTRLGGHGCWSVQGRPPFCRSHPPRHLTALLTPSHSGALYASRPARLCQKLEPLRLKPVELCAPHLDSAAIAIQDTRRVPARTQRLRSCRRAICTRRRQGGCVSRVVCRVCIAAGPEGGLGTL